jgi:hypothetical protein
MPNIRRVHGYVGMGIMISYLYPLYPTGMIFSHFIFQWVFFVSYPSNGYIPAGYAGNGYPLPSLPWHAWRSRIFRPLLHSRLVQKRQGIGAISFGLQVDNNFWEFPLWRSVV